jgi:hypothetical protein
MVPGTEHTFQRIFHALNESNNKTIKILIFGPFWFDIGTRLELASGQTLDFFSSKIQERLLKRNTIL